MIRIGLLSEDRTLQSLISSALGKEFDVLLASTEDRNNRTLSAGGCDVALLDLDSDQDSLQQRMECSRRIIASQIPSVVMATDGLRATAAELVRLGASGYCRRPPSIRHLKSILPRAPAHSSLNPQLPRAQLPLTPT